MKRMILIALTLFTLAGCGQDQADPEMNVPVAGSGEFSRIMDAEDPVAEVERRLKVAIAQQENDSFSPTDLIVDELSNQEKEETDHDVLAYYTMGNPDIYFALEDTNELSLTIVTEEAAEFLGEDLQDLINIFIRTSDPSLDLEEGDYAADLTLHSSNNEEDYDFFQTDFVSIEYSRNGYIPYADSHFTDEFSEETLFYSSMPLSELPNDQ